MGGTRQGFEGAKPAFVSLPEPASLAARRTDQVHEVILCGAASDCKCKNRVIGRFRARVAETQQSDIRRSVAATHLATDRLWEMTGSLRLACPKPGSDA